MLKLFLRSLNAGVDVEQLQQQHANGRGLPQTGHGAGPGIALGRAGNVCTND